MKKIFNLILAALVIIGAAACTKSDEIVDQTQQSEGLSFYAEIVNGNTRAYIDDSNEDKVWNTIWDKGDNVYVSLPDNDPFTFTYDGEKFTCSEPGVTSLIGETVTVGPCNVNEDSTAGKKAWSFTGTKVEKFDNNATVNLTADTSFFRYTYNGTGDVTITVTPKEGDTKVFSYCVKEDVFDYYPSITFKGAAEDKFVGFWPQTLSGLEATLSYSIDGKTCKETSITLYPGKVYNLGDLSPVASLSPNEEWNEGNARFAAFFFGNGETWVDMTDTDSNGIYECAIPAGYPSVIFCRMNPDKAENNWDNKWNQTPDLDVNESYGKYYYITGWNIGEWQVPGFEFPAITTLYLKPNSNWLQSNARFAAYFFNDNIGKNKWVSMTDTNSDGIYEVTIPTDYSYPNVIFCRMNPGAAANDWGNKWNQTSNLTISTRRNNLYTINDGSWDAGWWSIK